MKPRRILYSIHNDFSGVDGSDNKIYSRNSKLRRIFYGMHNDFSGAGGGLRRGCTLIGNGDGWGG